MRSDWDDAEITYWRDRVLDADEHEAIVPPMAGIAPWCSCGWPETEGGKRMVWRPGDKTLAQHLLEARA